MKPLLAIPDTFQLKFDQMWRSACRVCDNVRKYILERWMEFDDIALAGHGRWARYIIPIPLQRYTNKLKEVLNDPHQAYWLLPSRLMFCERPWFTKSAEGAEWVRKENYILTQRGRPNRKNIRQILDQIDQLLAGCYLSRHGQAGNAALLALQA
jgi:hypothetical protein